MKRVVVIGIVLTGILLHLGIRAVARSLFSDNDTHCYLAAANAVIQGQDLYEGTGYLYPTFLAIVLVPIRLLGENVAAVLWGMAITAAGAVALWLLARQLPFTPVRRAAAALATLVLCFRAFASNAGNGQANTFVLLSFVVVGVALTRRRDAVAGWAAAVGGLIKVMPVGLLLYFLLRRRDRALVHGVLVLVLGAGLLPLMVFGPEGTRETTRIFTENSSAVAVIQSPTGQPNGGFVPGQSLRTVLARYGGPSDAESGDDQVTLINLANVDASTLNWIYRGVMLLVGLVGLLAWSGAESDPDRRVHRDLAVAALVALLVAPVARKASYVLLAVPYMYILSELLLYRWRDVRGGVMAGLVGFGALLLAVVTAGSTPSWAPVAVLASVLGVVISSRGTYRLAFALSFSASTLTLSSRGLLGVDAAHAMLAYTTLTFGSLVLFVSLVLHAVQRAPAGVDSDITGTADVRPLTADTI